MVGVFKKAAGFSGKIESKVLKDGVDECVRSYTGLVVGSRFVEFEEDGMTGEIGLTNGSSGFS